MGFGRPKPIGDLRAVWLRTYPRAVMSLLAESDGAAARYVRELHVRLPAGCRGLPITLEYPQHGKPGPPFAVAGAEL